MLWMMRLASTGEQWTWQQAKAGAGAGLCHAAHAHIPQRSPPARPRCRRWRCGRHRRRPSRRHRWSSCAAGVGGAGACSAACVWNWLTWGMESSHLKGQTSKAVTTAFHPHHLQVRQLGPQALHLGRIAQRCRIGRRLVGSQLRGGALARLLRRRGGLRQMGSGGAAAGDGLFGNGPAITAHSAACSHIHPPPPCPTWSAACSSSISAAMERCSASFSRSARAARASASRMSPWEGVRGAARRGVGRACREVTPQLLQAMHASAC